MQNIYGLTFLMHCCLTVYFWVVSSLAVRMIYLSMDFAGVIFYLISWGDLRILRCCGFKMCPRFVDNHASDHCMWHKNGTMYVVLSFGIQNYLMNTFHVGTVLCSINWGDQCMSVQFSAPYILLCLQRLCFCVENDNSRKALWNTFCIFNLCLKILFPSF
jgi:hypothetical protein